MARRSVSSAWRSGRHRRFPNLRRPARRAITQRAAHDGRCRLRPVPFHFRFGRRFNSARARSASAGGPANPRATTSFSNAAGFKVEFLTPNRGKDDFAGEPAPMPALGGASAQPLSYLDFLIHQPVRSVLLHKGGVAVLVPAPERFAVHKLIVSELRRADRDRASKARKDLEQASVLIEALANSSSRLDLGLAYIEARDRGQKWREALEGAEGKLPPEVKERLQSACADAGAVDG